MMLSMWQNYVTKKKTPAKQQTGYTVRWKEFFHFVHYSFAYTLGYHMEVKKAMPYNTIRCIQIENQEVYQICIRFLRECVPAKYIIPLRSSLDVTNWVCIYLAIL